MKDHDCIGDSPYVGSKTFEEVGEDFLRKAHERLFFERLIPLGGVELGQDSEGRLRFALNKSGRYFLTGVGAVEPAGDPDGTILVQPNFEIVFTHPNPLLEAELAGLAERCGSRVGTLFRLTRDAIRRAALMGSAFWQLWTVYPENRLISLRELADRTRHELSPVPGRTPFRPHPENIRSARRNRLPTPPRLQRERRLTSRSAGTPASPTTTSGPLRQHHRQPIRPSDPRDTDIPVCTSHTPDAKTSQTGMSAPLLSTPAPPPTATPPFREGLNS